MPSVKLAPPARPIFLSPYHIAGSVTVQVDPAMRMVRVYRRTTGALIKQVRSNADGVFVARGLPNTRVTIMALDVPSNEFEAVVADNVQPVKEGEAAS